MSATPTQMPYSIRLTILMVILSDQTVLFMVPTFVSYMVSGFYPDESDPSLISSRSGYIEGAAGCCGLIGCMFWGWISDSIGRKRALIIVLSGIIICSLSFGLSPNYEASLAARGMAGLMAGVVPISKALIQDISDESNITILYSYLGMGYGFGSIVGPLIGGVLAQPARGMIFFRGTIFETFPYFLPMICHSLIVLVAICMVLKYVKPKPAGFKAIKSDKGFADLARNKNYMMGVLVFVLIGIVQFGYRIVMACWVKVSEEDGGLGFGDEFMVGIMNSLSGVIVTFYHFYGVPELSKRFGVIDSGIVINLKLLPVIAIVSFCNLLIDRPFAFWPIIIIANGLSIALTTAYISFISIAVANSVSPDILGLATGITQSVIACIRGVSIAVFGIIFAAFQRWKLGFPFDLHFPFFIMIMILFAIFALVKFGLNRDVEKRKPIESELVSLLHTKGKV